MKKNNNIKQLKEMVNNSVVELVRLHVDGVQAYNISNNEYEVIVKFEKLRGRYYFIDRDGNKYLASSYDRAEFVAGEILERVAEEAATVKEAADSIAEKGEATIIFDLSWNYIDECDARGINHGELVDRTEDAAGKMYNVYRIETAADEQQSENKENDEQSNEDNEDNENAAACEPSKLSGILAKMKGRARKVCEKVALIIALALVMVVTFTTLFCLIYFIPDLLDLFGIECGSFAAIALSLLLFCTVIIDTCVFVELNTMAAIEHFFPTLFGSAQKPGFTKPFCFWYRLVNESL